MKLLFQISVKSTLKIEYWRLVWYNPLHKTKEECAMGWLEWKYELDNANSEYDNKRISREVYITREKFAIYMIHKCGNEEAAEKIAKAHGYRIENLIKEYEDNNL